MLIKTFIADSSASALKQVRAAMGTNAVVLQTRQITDPGKPVRIEITACLDNPTIEQSTTILSDSQTGRRATPSRVFTPTQRVKLFAPQTMRSPLTDPKNRLNSLSHKSAVAAQSMREQERKTTELRNQLQDADVSAPIIETLLASALNQTNVNNDLSSVMLDHLIEQLSSSMMPKLTFNAGDKILFLGAAGSGKTSAMGKLAAHLVFQEKQKTNLVTLDNVKIGACEEIQSYADILDVEASEYRADHEPFESQAVTVIDTPSLPQIQEQLRALAADVLAIKPTHCFAVFPSLTRSSDLADFARRVTPFHPTHLIMTMLDLTERWGSVLTALKETGLPLAFVTNSPAGIGTINVPDPSLFARTILKAGACLE